MKPILVLAFLLASSSAALDRPGVTFKIFQFPADKIPRIDGNAEDWKIVPDDYAIGMDQLVDDTHKDRKPDPQGSRRQGEGRLGQGSQPPLLSV